MAEKATKTGEYVYFYFMCGFTLLELFFFLIFCGKV